jgi:hypothetical protein
MKQWAARAVISISVGALGAVVAGCSSTPDRSEGRYCTEVGNHLIQLNQPVLRNSDDLAAMLTTWRTVADAAPIAIQGEWDTVLGAMARAASVNPNDPASLQKAADGARAAEPAANRVIEYTFQKCGATIGNVAPVITTPTGSTTAPTAPATTGIVTTLPGASTTSSPAGPTTTVAAVTPTITVVVTTTTG